MKVKEEVVQFKLYMLFKSLAAIVVLGCFGFISAGSAAESQKAYTFGIVPQQTASKLARTWEPVLKYLEGKTGYQFNFATAKNIPTFEQRLEKGQYDFAYMNPYHYVVYHQQPGYQAFAKAKDKQIHGIVVVHKDSSYKHLEDLSGQDLAFPSPLAFAASILPRSELQQRNVKFQPVYVSSHDSVYRNVSAKNFAAGGGVVRTFKSVEPKVQGELRVLYKTKGYTPHAFAAHPSVPKEIVKKVVSAFEQMEKDAEGRQLLQSLKVKGIEAATDKSWDDVRKLNISQ